MMEVAPRHAFSDAEREALIACVAELTRSQLWGMKGKLVPDNMQILKKHWPRTPPPSTDGGWISVKKQEMEKHYQWIKSKMKKVEEPEHLANLVTILSNLACWLGPPKDLGPEIDPNTGHCKKCGEYVLYEDDECQNCKGPGNDKREEEG